MNELENYHEQIIEPRPAHFEGQYEPGSESTTEMVTGILRRWYIVLLVFVTMCGIGIPAIWLSIKPLYTVTGSIRVAPLQYNLLTGEPDRGEISNYSSYMYTQAEMITSNRVVQRVADELADKNLTFLKKPPTGLVQKLKNKLEGTSPHPAPAAILKQAIINGTILVSPGQRNELIKVSADSFNQDEAKQIVDAFIRAYMAVEVSSATSEEAKKIKLLEDEQKFLAEKIKRKRDAVRQLAQEYGTTSLGGRQNIMIEQTSSLLSELTGIESQRRRLEIEVEFLENSKGETTPPEELVRARQEYVNEDYKVKTLVESITQLEQELIVDKQKLAPGNPNLKQKADLIEELTEYLNRSKEKAGETFDESVANVIAKTGTEKLKAKQAELEKVRLYEERFNNKLTEVNKKAIEIGRKQLTIDDLKDELNSTKEMYEKVGRRISELEMQRKRPARITVADKADVSQIRDKRMKYSAALLFGAFAFGMFLAFLMNKADKSIRTPQDVTKRIGIRIIGTTTSPHAVKSSLLPKQVAGDYQNIRANLGLLGDDGMPKKLVVSSPSMREGKTTFAINLATSMAKSGKKVLLIDGDLRKPDIAHLLNLPKGSRGLQDVLFGRDNNHTIYTVPSSGLDVLAADFRNRTDAYELLTLPVTAQRINRISQNYDQIIIDTPPVLAFPDALVWAKLSDAAILTSFAGQTSAPDLAEARQKLEQINVKVLGTVLANVPISHSYYRYGYNYYAQSSQRSRKHRKTNAKLLLPLQENNDNTTNAES